MNLDLRFYISILIRRFPIMALLMSISTGLGVYSAIRLPDSYRTSARLLVEEPQIPDSMVASTVRTDAVEQLDIIEQRLLTRANLIDIASRFDVFEDFSDLSPDDVVDQMRSATRIRRTAGRNQATLMTISFEGRSGRVVAAVVNEYVTLVLQENIEFRTSRAENTLEFFEQEAGRLAAELDEQSVAIANFKSENAAALPEDQSFRLGRQSLLQERLSLLERDIRLTEAQRDEVRRIFEATGDIQSRNRPTTVQSPEAQQLLVAKADLDLLLSVYSEENPRVVRQRGTVTRLEAIVAAQEAAGLEGVDSEGMSSQEAMFQVQLIEIENRLEALRGEVESTESELATVAEAIAASSANGITLDGLERDFETIQGRYNAAIANLNQARMSERIETTAQGQRISVIENANVPSGPSGPNRPQVAATGAALGLGLAGGYFMLLEFLNRTVRRPMELVNRFQVTPITSIPYMESRSHRAMRRLALLFATLVVLVGVPYGLWYVDTNFMPLDLIVTKALNKLGLG